MAAFVKAVELGSFAAAAAALDLSGPMVGKHVRFLEERLGVRLINRTTRRQGLTEFGRAYYERCRTVLAEAAAADALAADQLSRPCGKLRVTMPVLFGRRCVTPTLLALARKYPALELDISFSDRIADLAEDGYDLAIRTGDLDNKAGVIARRIARQRMIVCASPSYVEMHGRPQKTEDLGKHPAIIYRRSGRIRPWLFPRKGEAPVEVTPVNRLRLDDLDAIAEAAASGMGLPGFHTGSFASASRQAHWSRYWWISLHFPTTAMRCGCRHLACHSRCVSPWMRWRLLCPDS
jgi:DNA-binding transcriptional LysR family regulator